MNSTKMMNQEKSTVREQSAKNQYLAGLVVSIALVNYGVTTGWPSPAIDLLGSNKSPLPTGPITTEEASWIASVMGIGALPGNMIFGLLIKKFGRKWPLVATSVLVTISWMLVLFAQNVYFLYAARLIQGFVKTPYFLVRQNKIPEAKKSLRFYRSVQEEESEYLEIEISKLKSAVGGNDTKKRDDRSYKLSDFTTRPGSKAMIIASILVLLNQLSGITAMISYTATIFGAAGSALSNNDSAMIVGVIQLLGTFVVTPLIDRYGRRILYITSTFGTAVGLIALGLYMNLNSHGVSMEGFNWIPIVAFSSTIFTSAWAIQALPIAVTAEVLPEKLKEIGVTYAITLLSAASFFVIKFLPIIGYEIGIFFFAAVCIVCGLLITKILPETKGRSYQEIMDSLS